MSNNYDTWKAGGYKTERDEKLYTEEQILIEQIETLETRLKEKTEHVLYLKSQLNRLSELEMMFKTFGKLSFDEQQEKNKILRNYETI